MHPKEPPSLRCVVLAHGSTCLALTVKLGSPSPTAQRLPTESMKSTSTHWTTTTMTTATAATFHPFPRLPSELRARIWELSVEPRIVEVRVVHHDPSPVKVTDPDSWTDAWMKKRLPPVRHLRSHTPAPAQLHACSEAREHLSKYPNGGYQKAFSEIMTTATDGFDPVPEDDPQGERNRYVWFNFGIDVMSVGATDLHDFRAVAHQVRRLRLERELSSEYFSYTESKLFRKFGNLAEVHLVCLDGVLAGYGVTNDIYFPCGPENVYFVDPEEMGGKVMNSVDLDAMMDGECDEFDRME
ncbi:hypothetical protein QC761_405540 [Podospora bellae-mahoneyi]|uniref:2EXR domain-containing protein n=1 Tax=Podospora bellae-mahoneyi TaxID=2093777 RepID=A0ABR0FLG1_9PEZI|nr:hypothetical protein QC761_405540 [Podospora bellae-mahoneyi]